MTPGYINHDQSLFNFCFPSCVAQHRPVAAYAHISEGVVEGKAGFNRRLIPGVRPGSGHCR